MRNKVAVIVCAFVAVASFVGCQSTPTGQTRAGFPFVRDTIPSRYQRPVPQIFAAARKVLELNGTLTSENTINNSLEARVDNRRVIVMVQEVEPGVSEVLVEARTKGGMPDLVLAAELDKQIALHLK
jgi:hypothetical protein